MTSDNSHLPRSAGPAGAEHGRVGQAKSGGLPQVNQASPQRDILTLPVGSGNPQTGFLSLTDYHRSERHLIAVGDSAFSKPD